MNFDPFDFLPWWSQTAMLVATIVVSAGMTLLLLTKYRSTWDTRSHRTACDYKNFLFPWSGGVLIIGVFILVWDVPQGGSKQMSFLVYLVMIFIPLMQITALVAYVKNNHRHE